MNRRLPKVDLRGLPPTFTYTQARTYGLSDRRLYQLRDNGQVELIAHGLYRRADSGDAADLDLLEIAVRAPQSTVCLTSALARHELTDDIPRVIDIAVPRNQHRPATVAPVAWHTFDRHTFEIGRTDLDLGGATSIGLYGPERSIIDAVRLRHREGPELGYLALRRWLGRRGSIPSDLLEMARHFPNAEKAIREALEILL